MAVREFLALTSKFKTGSVRAHDMAAATTKDDDGADDPPGRPLADPNEARLRQQAIGVRLRHMFNEIVNEPVPEDFLDILRRADDKGGAGGKG